MSDGDRSAASRPLPSDQDASGRSFGSDELARVAAVLERGTLTSTKGPEVPELEATLAARFGVAASVATSSGTSAVHAAIVSLDPEPGDEIITTGITDMGALTPILYQGAIPVFADVDPRTGNVTAATVEAGLSPRTRAIVVTHLFGNPAVTAPILELAAAHRVPVIEDCAQAFLARVRGRLVGTLGAVGCFSLQQGKHITCGEGGFVITDDPVLARRMRLFVNKAWPYGEADPDHEFLALNARLTELQAAVANAQLAKLDALVERRIELAQRLVAALEGIVGVAAVPVAPGAEATWWRFPVLVDREVVPGGPDAVARSLRLDGIASAPRYVRKPAFQCRVFTEQRTFGSSRWPFTLARPEALDASPERFPGTFAFLESVLVLPWNERLTEDDVDGLAGAIAAAVEAGA